MNEIEALDRVGGAECAYGPGAVNAALKEWKDAVRYFENVKDPELVDFAIFEMEAARRKYMFLLKRIKQR